MLPVVHKLKVFPAVYWTRILIKFIIIIIIIIIIMYNCTVLFL
jgi:hypothetical protein